MNICELPKSEGPCRGAFESYYYNRQTGLCEFFNYGGCGGNPNNFPSIELCVRRCVD